MTQPPRRQCESNIYHVVTRGVGRQIIFEDDSDRRAFCNLLVKITEEPNVDILAWCLMDNHVHLLLQAKMEDLSKAMQRALSVYATGFNERHLRTGHVFESRFRSEPIESDAHLLSAVRYIHQNPAKAGLASTSAYRWSSYKEYSGETAKGICDTALVLSMFGSKKEFIAFHETTGEGCSLEDNDGRGEVAAKRALRTAIDELGEEGVHNLKSLPLPDRNDAIRRLNARGVTARQIGRIAGISHTTVVKVLRQGFPLTL